ncbi:MAG: transaldolase [Xanthomonadales bacterium]|nr:transaldolase [Xanthomonadales bacterium]
MKPTQRLHDLGQSLWLDNITRDMLDDGTLERYIDEFSVTGLTSNPSIFDKAISAGHAYDDGIREKVADGKHGETLFIELALEDLRRAADLFKPIHEKTDGVDGWVSMEVSPLLASNTDGSIEAAAAIHQQADRENLFVKIPGTPEGLPAIEQSIFNGVPINVTLLFSADQCMAATEACLRGLERRQNEGRDLRLASVVSVFISRWDVAVAGREPPGLRNGLGIAVAQRTWREWCTLVSSERWKRLEAAGALMPRLLWASTSTKDPNAPDTLYVEALAAPGTIDTIPDKTLEAFAEHGKVGEGMDPQGADSDKVLATFEDVGIGIAALADKLQRDGAAAFVKSWNDLLGRIEEKGKSLAEA